MTSLALQQLFSTQILLIFLRIKLLPRFLFQCYRPHILSCSFLFTKFQLRPLEWVSQVSHCHKRPIQQICLWISFAWQVELSAYRQLLWCFLFWGRAQRRNGSCRTDTWNRICIFFISLKNKNRTTLSQSCAVMMACCAHVKSDYKTENCLIGIGKEFKIIRKSKYQILPTCHKEIDEKDVERISRISKL